MAHRIKLGELLVRAGVLDDAKLKAALHEQERWGGRLGATLVAMGFVAEDLLVKALSKQLAVPIAHLESIDVPDSVLRKIDLDFAKMNAVCPERYLPERRTLLVAMADPINVQLIDEMGRRTGLRVQPTVSGERAINLAIGRMYGESVSEVGSADLIDERFRTSPVPTEPPAAPSAPPSTAAAVSLDLVAALEAAQRKQHKAIRVMAELLIERGVLPRDEYLARLDRRSS